MLNLIDFSQCKENPKKSFLGASSPKKCLIYNGEQYMLSFLPFLIQQERL